MDNELELWPGKIVLCRGAKLLAPKRARGWVVVLGTLTNLGGYSVQRFKGAPGDLNTGILGIVSWARACSPGRCGGRRKPCGAFSAICLDRGVRRRRLVSKTC